jgi:hypothetical protein
VHLGQRRRLVADVIEHVVGKHAIQACAAQRQGFGVRLDRVNVETCVLRLALRLRHHAE